MVSGFRAIVLLGVGSSGTPRLGADNRQTGNYSGLEVGLGAITAASGVFQPEFVVHCLAESLLAAEITLGGLNRCVSKQELNLLKFSTG